MTSGRTIYHPAIKNNSSAILRLFELALVLVRFDHLASVIVNANHNGEWLKNFDGPGNPLSAKTHEQSTRPIIRKPTRRRAIRGNPAIA
jgi:hypothetical protein